MQTKSEKIAEQLITAINSGKYTSNLPSEKELSRLYNTTAVTAGKALNILQKRNIVHRVPRLGTFINQSSEAPIRMCLNIPEFIVKEIKAVLKKKFPNLKIEIYDIKGTDPLDGDFDIIRTAATFPHSFSRYFKPLPDAALKKYRDCGKYFPQLIDVCCDYEVHYALPILFSPLVLAYNKKLAAKLGFSPCFGNFCFEELVKLAQAASKHSIKLINAEEALVWIRYALFNGLTPQTGLALDELSKKLRLRVSVLMDILKDVSDSPAGSFQRGEVLFQPICRQLLISGEETFAFPWDLLPMPKLPEARPPVTGEFLAVKSSSKAQDDAFKVMLAFLDEDIQRIFARHKFGLPVMKSMIADTLDSRKYRDDLFVTEVNRMAVDNAVNHDLHVACLPPVTDFQSGRIMPAEFCEEVIEIFLEMTQAARRQKKAKQYYSYTGI